MPEQAPQTRKWKNEPVLMHADAIRNAVADLAADRAGLMTRSAPTSALQAAYGAGASLGPDKPFAFVGGAAIIPIHGGLWHRSFASYGWATGYDAIRTQFLAALDDEEVDAIVFDVDSPGGDAAGCFELSAMIYAARGKKPMTAVIDASCYSAAYAIASAADKMVITPSGGAGSIGVVTSHVDVSKAMEQDGVKVTLIYAGKHKVDGNPYQPLKSDARARIQGRLDYLYSEFVATVARNRGLDESAVRQTEAATFTATEALDRGLVDAISTPQEALAALFAELSGSKKPFGDTTMSTPEKKTPEATAAEQPENQEQPVVEVAPDAAAQERERISAILSSDEAKGRESLAQHFAFKSGMSVEDALAALAAAPVAAPAPAKPNSSAFDAAMTATGNPNVGEGDGQDGNEVDAAQQILKDYGAATGFKPVTKH